MLGGIFTGSLIIIKKLFEKLDEDDRGIVLERACQSNRLEIVKYLLQKGVDIHYYFDTSLREAVVIGAIRKGNNVHVGYGGKAIAGRYGTATAGVEGTATAGKYGTAIAGDYGTAIAGFYGIAIAGNRGKATAGEHGKATAGEHGKAIAGDGGEAIAGSYGEATAGNYGKAIAGYHGKVQAGYKGLIKIEIEYYEVDCSNNSDRLRKVVGYIGEDGLKPNVLYYLNNEYKFEEIS